jgi:hypothetical protein
MNAAAKREEWLPTSEAPAVFAFIINETPEGRFIVWSGNQSLDWLPRMCHFLSTGLRWSPQETYFGAMANGFWFIKGKTWRRTDFDGACATDDDGVNIDFQAFRPLTIREIYLLATCKLDPKELPDVKE